MNSYLLRDEDRDDEVGEGTIAFTSTKPFEPSMLDTEITQAHNWRKQAGVVTEGDPAGATDDNPVTFWVTRDDADTDTVRKVLADHDASAHPLTGYPLDPLRAKALGGKKYTDAEVQTILRQIVLERTGGPVEL